MRVAVGVAAPDDQPGQGTVDFIILRRFLGYVWPHRGRVAVALALLLVLSMVQAVQPYIIKLAIDGPITEGDLAGLFRWVMLFLGLLLGEATLRYFQLVALEGAGQRVLRDLRRQVFAHIIERPMAFFDRHVVGRLITRVTSDVEALNELFSQGVLAVLGDLVKMLLIASIIFQLDVTLSLVSLVSVPLLLGLSFYFQGRIRATYRRVRYLLSRLNAFLAESLAGMAIVQLFGREEREMERFLDSSEAYRDAEVEGVRYESLFSALVEFVGTIATAMILWAGAERIGMGAVTFGTLVAFIEYAKRFFQPLQELSTKYAVLQSAMASAERVFEILDDDSSLSGYANQELSESFRGGGGGGLEFDRVSFSYRDDEPVLRDVSFSVAPGERVALVGATGSGKSTVIRLLARLYDVRRGAVRVQGIDVRDWDPTALRESLGVVTQDVFLFMGTIRDNVALGAPRGADGVEAVARASALAQLDAVLGRLPQGLDTDVREWGANLSSGERQLVTFARALARDPSVLMLDEATASVDPATEERIQRATQELLEGRTALVVAHRLSTVRAVDRILVMRAGQIVESGSHEELMALGGVYQRLYTLQLGDEPGAVNWRPAS